MLQSDVDEEVVANAFVGRAAETPGERFVAEHDSPLPHLLLHSLDRQHLCQRLEGPSTDTDLMHGRTSNGTGGGKGWSRRVASVPWYGSYPVDRHPRQRDRWKVGAKPTQAELSLALHRIVDAASALIANVDHLARHAPAEDQQTVEDCRESIDLIARLARAVRAALEGKPVIGLSGRVSDPRLK